MSAHQPTRPLTAPTAHSPADSKSTTSDNNSHNEMFFKQLFFDVPGEISNETRIQMVEWYIASISEAEEDHKAKNDGNGIIDQGFLQFLKMKLDFMKTSTKELENRILERAKKLLEGDGKTHTLTESQRTALQGISHTIKNAKPSLEAKSTTRADSSEPIPTTSLMQMQPTLDIAPTATTTNVPSPAPIFVASNLTPRPGAS